MNEGSGRPERREIEVKLPCPNLLALREKLAELSAICTAPLHFETNDLYDDSERRLSRTGCTLRMRRAGGAATLTFKGPARFSDAVKIREERETAVADDGEMRAILAGLGLNRRFRYEKRREEWRLESVSVCLDETPIGNFVEVEGDPAAIRRALSSLQLDFAAALPYSYARLYAERRKHDPSLPEDMVFQNVKR